MDELPEAAARVVEILRLFMAPREKGLEQCGGADGVGAGEPPNFGCHLFQAAHE